MESVDQLMLLPDELLQRILARLDGPSLVHAEQACSTLQLLADEQGWRAVGLARWGWLFQHTTAGRPLRPSYARLHTLAGVRFCVVGGSSSLALNAFDQHGASSRGNAVAFHPLGLDDSAGLSGLWAPLPLPQFGSREAPAVVRAGDGALVCMGGTSRDLLTGEFRTLDSVERCAAPYDEWQPLPHLTMPRCCCGAAVDAESRIYCIGGGESMYRGAKCYDTCEVYDPARGRWAEAPTLLEKRCALGAAISHATTTLFAVGGYGGGDSAQAYLSSAESCRISAGGSGVWEPLPPLSVQRAGVSAAVGPCGRIFAIGGGPDGRHEWNTMEVLDPRCGHWDTSLAPLHVGRHYNACAFGPDGCLYVSGAFRHDGQLDAVERYDPRMDQWEELPQIGEVVTFSAGGMPCRLCSNSRVALAKPHNSSLEPKSLRTT